MPKRRALDEMKQAFWSKVDKKNGPILMHMKTRCWIWTGCKTNTGYGCFYGYLNEIYFQSSHRFAYYIVTKQYPHTRTDVIMHKCDNPSCVRFSHLVFSTQKKNSLDSVSKHRHISFTHPEKQSRGLRHSEAMTKSRKNHPERHSCGLKHATATKQGILRHRLKGQISKCAILTSEEVYKIKFDEYKGKRGDIKRLAHKYGVWPQTISHIIHNRKWVFITKAFEVQS